MTSGFYMYISVPSFMPFFFAVTAVDNRLSVVMHARPASSSALLAIASYVNLNVGIPRLIHVAKGQFDIVLCCLLWPTRGECWHGQCIDPKLDRNVGGAN